MYFSSSGNEMAVCVFSKVINLGKVIQIQKGKKTSLNQFKPDHTVVSPCRAQRSIDFFRLYSEQLQSEILGLLSQTWWDMVTCLCTAYKTRSEDVLITLCLPNTTCHIAIKRVLDPKKWGRAKQENRLLIGVSNSSNSRQRPSKWQYGTRDWGIEWMRKSMLHTVGGDVLTMIRDAIQDTFVPALLLRGWCRQQRRTCGTGRSCWCAACAPAKLGWSRGNCRDCNAGRGRVGGKNWAGWWWSRRRSGPGRAIEPGCSFEAASKPQPDLDCMGNLDLCLLYSECRSE